MSIKQFFDKVEQRVLKEETQCECNMQSKVTSKITALKYVTSKDGQLTSQRIVNLQKVFKPILSIDYRKLISAITVTEKFKS